MVNKNASITLGQRIRRLRGSRGWEQPELARRLDVHKNTVSRWERSGIEPPARRLKQIAKVFGVSVTYLLTGQQDQTKPAAPEPEREPEPEPEDGRPHTPPSETVVGTAIVWLSAMENALVRMTPLLDAFQGAAESVENSARGLQKSALAMRALIEHAQQDAAVARRLLHEHHDMRQSNRPTADADWFERTVERVAQESLRGRAIYEEAYRKAAEEAQGKIA